MAINQATLELLVQLKDQASSGLSSLGGALSSLGGIAAGGALAAVTALGAGIVGGVGDAREAARIFAQTEAVITSTGQAAGVTAQQVTDYAASLSAASGQSLFGDSQIQESTNLLLTFTEIKGKTLEAATAISVDMAQAMGGAPKDAAIQLGKALNDPVAGITALSRVGVSFTDQQKEQIKTMQEAGNTAGAQAIILAELNKEFGGSAKAAADADGGMARFKDVIGETFESVGGKLLPVLNRFAEWLNSPEVQAAIAVFAEKLGNGIVIAADFIANKLVPAVVDLYNWLAPRLGPILAEIGRALSEDLPRGIARAQLAWEGFQLALRNFDEGYIQPIKRGFDFVVSSVGNAQKSFDAFITGVQNAVIPSWLQGHSPPPLADWLSYIGDAADTAAQALPAFNAGVNGADPSLAALSASPGSAGGSGGMVIQNLTLHMTSSASNAQQLFTEFRDMLNRVQQQNVTSGVA